MPTYVSLLRGINVGGKSLKMKVPVLTLPAVRLKKVLTDNPFLKRMDIDLSKLHVTFLAKTPKSDLISNVAAIPAGKDEFVLKDDLVYLHCPKGYGKTKLSNAALEKILSVQATTRNWNTVNMLHKMANMTAIPRDSNTSTRPPKSRQRIET